MPEFATGTYPRIVELRDESRVTLRPLASGDAAALADFFARLPAEDRFFMKDDVLDPAVIRRWVEQTDRSRFLPIVAVAGDRIVADATLLRHRGGFRAHQAELRITIDKEYRSRGLGTVMLRELAQIAWDADLEFLEFEMVAGVQDDAIEAVTSIGAFPVGELRGFVRDQDGAERDVVYLRLPLGKWWRY